MEYRILGRTGLKTGIIGLGTEYLIDTPAQNVAAVVHKALDAGGNYIDLFFAQAQIRDNVGAALKNRRSRAILAAHLGAAEKDGQYLKTRDTKLCEKYFLDFLARLHTDCVDFLMLHNVDKEDDHKKVMDKLLPMALEYKKQGKTRFIGYSGHTVATSLKAVESGYVDMLMFPVNPTDGAKEGRERLFSACVNRSVGIIAMKPYAGGKLLREQKVPISPSQCISYALSQIGVTAIVPGAKTPAEFDAALDYLKASDKEKDFAEAVKALSPELKGGCVYCNHCLPCPAKIDIGQINRLVDAAKAGISQSLKSAYADIRVKASACKECAACMKRCPWGVDVVAKMKKAAALFEQAA